MILKRVPAPLVMDTNGGNIPCKRKKMFDSSEYMNIDEFMQVLYEAELITPFGRLQTADLNQVGLKNVGWFSQMEQSDCSRSIGRKAIIPLTPIVVEVLETERNLRDIDTETSDLRPYGPQHTKKIMADSALTNYLLLLSEKEDNM